MLFRAKGTAPNGAHPWNEYFLQKFGKNISQEKFVISKGCCSEQNYSAI
jgi:hypothetical protein